MKKVRALFIEPDGAAAAIMVSRGEANTRDFNMTKPISQYN